MYLLIALACLAWFATGFAVCTARHKQRGLEVDHMILPDFVPSDFPSFRERIDA